MTMSMLEGLRPEMRQALDDIGACFRGDDGGVTYLRFVQNLSAADKAAAAGEDLAIHLISIVTYFHKLVKLSA